MKKAYFLLLCLLLLCVDCSTNNESNEGFGEKVFVKLIPTMSNHNQGIFNVSTQNDIALHVIYAIQIYENNLPSYYGLFDDLSKMNIELIVGNTYKFKIAAYLLGSGPGLKYKEIDGSKRYYLPNEVKLENKFVKGSGLDSINKISSIQLNHQGTMNTYPEIDVFYYEKYVALRKEFSCIDLPLSLMGFDISLNVYGLNSGKIDVTLGDDTIKFTPSKIEYNSIRCYKKADGDFSTILNSVDTYSEPITLNAKWTKENGLVKILKENITFKRNCKKPVNVTLNKSSLYITSEEWGTLDFVKPLFIQCPWGLVEPYHPSVVYFSKTWNRYKYWMAESPYPNNSFGTYKDRWECPCIHVSNDGITWNTPTGLTNPLDDLTSNEISTESYFSDPELVYNPTLNRLELYYRLTVSNATTTTFYRKTSKDGVTWSNREFILSFGLPTDENNPRSPGIIFENGLYKMISGRTAKKGSGYEVCYQTSKDGLVWSKKNVCEFDNATKAIWHLDFNKIQGEYILLAYIQSSKKLSIYKSKDLIHWIFYKDLLKVTPGTFYNRDLYRSSIENVDGHVEVFFTAEATTLTGRKVASLGLMKGATIDKLQVVSADEN